MASSIGAAVVAPGLGASQAAAAVTPPLIIARRESRAAAPRVVGELALPGCARRQIAIRGPIAPTPICGEEGDYEW